MAIGAIHREAGRVLEGSYRQEAWRDTWIRLFPFTVKEQYRDTPVTEIHDAIHKALNARGRFDRCTQGRWAGIHSYDPFTGKGEYAVVEEYMIGD